MRFTVTWHPLAIDELTRIWLDAANRDAVARATAAIDHTLAFDSSAKGAPQHVRASSS